VQGYFSFCWLLRKKNKILELAAFANISLVAVLGFLSGVIAYGFQTLSFNAVCCIT
jgi:hypothetical protein